MILGRVKRIVRRLYMFAPACPRVPASRCYYSRLGLFPGASSGQIRAAHHTARQSGLHPAAQRLVDEAYAVLSDPIRREIYLLVRRGLVAHGLAADSLQAAPDRSLLRVLSDLLRRACWKLRK